MSSKFRENPFIVSQQVSVFILTAIVKINNYDDDLMDVKERMELSYVNITYIIQFGNSYSSTNSTPWRNFPINKYRKRKQIPEDWFREYTRMNDSY